jgi:hypothetical protein
LVDRDNSPFKGKEVSSRHIKMGFLKALFDWVSIRASFTASGLGVSKTRPNPHNPANPPQPDPNFAVF